MQWLREESTSRDDWQLDRVTITKTSDKVKYEQNMVSRKLKVESLQDKWNERCPSRAASLSLLAMISLLE